ncbi:ABC-2 type transport system permease protein [Halogranum gelatinilyticum]|uniref:ABC-2 type transport system permease protein n=1 Tax=Halogranum gelatinilyticum TaxID=660521 RepID=A0A1G9X2T2_9EURY|nr:ABC transporter permease subunit [Halogranum gelatinilyticum]SDM91074.1 ABC-2 type transport system permease protein [Halogranum gelatinilyticum]
MLEITRYEARRRAKGSLALTLGVGVFTLLIVGIFPSIEASGVDFEAYVENLPPAFQEGFGVDGAALSTLEGFLSTEIYQFIWLLMLGLYVAYVAGNTVAGDIESGRMDVVLATPVSRTTVLVEKTLSLLVPIALLNLVVPLFVLAGAVAIDEPLDFGDVLLVHLLSVPYLLVCAAIGVLLSVLIKRADLAQRGSLAAVFALFLVDTVTAGTDFEWLGTLSPTRYFDPTEILVDSTVDVGGAFVLLVAAIVLVVVSCKLFQETDI